MSPFSATCDATEVIHLEHEFAKQPAGVNVAVGVIDLGDGRIRLYTYDETNDFSRGNPHLQVMASHESAATLAGIPFDRTRGFALGFQANVWHVYNLSHLNRADGQANSMQMASSIFAAIESALGAAGMTNLVVH